MKKLVVLLAVAALAGPALASNLDLSVQTSTGAPAITVSPGETVNYQVVGLLSDTVNEGLALFGFDLSFDGGPLLQADTPTSAPMTAFVIPDGITNPAGYGGTTDVPGREGELVQVGGAQNTINNVVTNAPYPIGAVITLIGQTEQVLVTGSLTAPDADGTYTLALTNAFANVIKDGETAGGAFWAVEEAGIGTVTNLTITVGGVSCFVVSTSPSNCAIDARQPSKPDGTEPAGWDRMEITFNDAACTAGLGAGDFDVTIEPAGTPVTISDVLNVGATSTVVLSQRISLGAWTCFTYGTDQTCIAALPADVNGDRTSAPADILKLIDHLNGVAVPPLALHQCDVDRSGLCGPPDILRVIDLLNGAGVYDSWLNVSMGVCPSP